MLYIRHLD